MAGHTVYYLECFFFFSLIDILNCNSPVRSVTFKRYIWMNFYSIRCNHIIALPHNKKQCGPKLLLWQCIKAIVYIDSQNPLRLNESLRHEQYCSHQGTSHSLNFILSICAFSISPWLLWKSKHFVFQCSACQFYSDVRG